MKVSELIELLKQQPQHAEVILSSDAEGNSYSPVCDHCEGRYVADTTWNGDFYSVEDTEDLDDGEGVKAVVLWPTS